MQSGSFFGSLQVGSAARRPAGLRFPEEIQIRSETAAYAWEALQPDSRAAAIMVGSGFAANMQTDVLVGEDSTLGSVRQRSQCYLSYLFWVLLILCSLWASNMVASLLDRWVAM